MQSISHFNNLKVGGFDFGLVFIISRLKAPTAKITTSSAALAFAEILEGGSHGDEAYSTLVQADER